MSDIDNDLMEDHEAEMREQDWMDKIDIEAERKADKDRIEELEKELGEIKNEPPLLPLMDRMGTKQLIEQSKLITDMMEWMEGVSISGLRKKQLIQRAKESIGR